MHPVAGTAGDPIEAIQRVLRGRAEKLTDEEVALGCPLNHLAQEMSSLDARFRACIDEMFCAWDGAFADALERGRPAAQCAPTSMVTRGPSSSRATACSTA